MQSKIELYGEVREAISLGKYVSYREMLFCRTMADVYGCVPLQTDGDNLNMFLSTIYHYGKVQGIRQERTRKQKRGQVGYEVTEIAKVLAETPLLYQLMKTATELNSVEPLKQAANFLKGKRK